MIERHTVNILAKQKIKQTIHNISSVRCWKPYSVIDTCIWHWANKYTYLLIVKQW